MSIKHILSFKAPKGPLGWPTLAALICFVLVALWLAWAIAESQLAQWGIIGVSLLLWNFLAVRAGESQSHIRTDERVFPRMSIALFLSTLALLAFAAVVADALRTSAVYPGREAVYFIAISVPLMIWVNVYLRRRRDEERF